MRDDRIYKIQCCKYDHLIKERLPGFMFKVFLRSFI